MPDVLAPPQHVLDVLGARAVPGPGVEPGGPGPAAVAVHDDTEVPGERAGAYGAP